MQISDGLKSLLAQIDKIESATIDQNKDPKKNVTTIHATNIKVPERFATFIAEDHKKK